MVVIPRDYDDHYKNVDATPAQLMIDIRYLRAAGKTKEIEKAIKAYLKFRPKYEPWMYYMLADAIELNKGPATEVRTALGWAGEIARKNDDVDSMIHAGDLMLARGLHGVDLKTGKGTVRVEAGDLLDRAIAKAPNRPEPILLSIKLAGDTKDPIRMASGVDHLLSLGWPLFDEAWREDALRQANSLVKSLREQNQSMEADALEQSVARSAGRDLFVRLSWIGDAGLELTVAEPLGATASALRPRTVFGGAIVKSVYGKGANAGCVYVCPRGFDGDYTIQVVVVYKGDEPLDGKKPNPAVDKPLKTAVLEIVTHEGTPEEQKVTKVISVNNPAPVVVTLKGGRRKTVLPLIAGPQTPARAPAKPAAPKPVKP